MSTEEEKRSNATAVTIGRRLLTAFLAVVGLLLWASPNLASIEVPSHDSMLASLDRAHLDHANKRPSPQPTERGEFPETDLEEDEEDEDDKDPDDLAEKPHRQRVAALRLRTHKQFDFAWTKKPSGFHNARGARSPPAA